MNNYSIKKIDEIFKKVIKLKEIIEVKEYEMSEILTIRKEFYTIPLEVINNPEFNIEKIYIRILRLLLKYCHNNKITLHEYLSVDRYLSHKRNYNHIVFLYENIKEKDGNKKILENSDIVINIILEMSYLITSFENILNLIQLGHNFFEFDLEGLLDEEIKIELNKNNIFLFS